MSSCDNLWLVLKLAYWALAVGSVAIAIFIAGHQHGRRVEAEQWDDAPEPEGRGTP